MRHDRPMRTTPGLDTVGIFLAGFGITSYCDVD